MVAVTVLAVALWSQNQVLLGFVIYVRSLSLFPDPIFVNYKGKMGALFTRLTKKQRSLFQRNMYSIMYNNFPSSFILESALFHNAQKARIKVESKARLKGVKPGTHLHMVVSAFNEKNYKHHMLLL